MEIFCLQADKLHEKMSSCPRLPNIPRIVTQPLPPTPDTTPPRSPVSMSRASATPSPEPVAPSPLLLSSRRMSRSENDLQKFFLQRSLNNLRHNSSQELILLSNENLGQIRKVDDCVEIIYYSRVQVQKLPSPNKIISYVLADHAL